MKWPTEPLYFRLCFRKKSLFDCGNALLAFESRLPVILLLFINILILFFKCLQHLCALLSLKASLPKSFTNAQLISVTVWSSKNKKLAARSLFSILISPLKLFFFFFFVTALYEQNYCFVSTSGKLIKSLMSTFSGRCFVNFMCKMK